MAVTKGFVMFCSTLLGRGRCKTNDANSTSVRDSLKASTTSPLSKPTNITIYHHKLNNCINTTTKTNHPFSTVSSHPFLHYTNILPTPLQTVVGQKYTTTTIRQVKWTILNKRLRTPAFLFPFFDPTNPTSSAHGTLRITAMARVPAASLPSPPSAAPAAPTAPSAGALRNSRRASVRWRAAQTPGEEGGFVEQFKTIWKSTSFNITHFRCLFWFSSFFQPSHPWILNRRSKNSCISSVLRKATVKSKHWEYLVDFQTSRLRSFSRFLLLQDTWNGLRKLVIQNQIWPSTMRYQVIGTKLLLDSLRDHGGYKDLYKTCKAKLSDPVSPLGDLCLVRLV